MDVVNRCRRSILGDEVIGHQDDHRHHLAVARSSTQRAPRASGAAQPVARDFVHRSNCPRGQLEGCGTEPTSRRLGSLSSDWAWHAMLKRSLTWWMS